MSEIKRALASIRRVRRVFPIEGADKIVGTQVDGWNCVTKVGEFKEGDLGVYFEIDSFLPATDSRYAFLEKQFLTFNGVKGARIRTIKLRGQIAQGLLLPISIFPEIANPQEGMDVTEILGITKWEPPISPQLAGQVRGNFPHFIKKTDEERIQNLIDEIKEHIAGRTFEMTIKLDGTSMTVYSHEEDNGVCGRNWNLKETEENSLWRVARKNKVLEALVSTGLQVALQGELIGEGIQDNNEKIVGHDFYLFNVWDIKNAQYMTPEQRKEVVKQLESMGAKVNEVPSLGFITFPEDVTVEDILAMADGKSLFAENREGLVFKRDDGQYSFKAISNWYLAKYSNR